MKLIISFFINKWWWGKLLVFDNFVESNYSSFEAEINIWKKEVDLFVDFSGGNEREKSESNEKYLQNSLNLIQEEIDWIKINKNKIKDVLLEEDSIELAETTASSAHLLECADEECYMMDDGSKVYFPITKDDFIDSLYIESVSVDFDEEMNTSIELILLCYPDYFRGQFFVIGIDKDKNINFKGLEEE